jgi:hypothetical protein
MDCNFQAGWVRRKGKKRRNQLNERKILLIYTHTCQGGRLSQLVRNAARLGHFHSILQLNQSFQDSVAFSDDGDSHQLLEKAPGKTPRARGPRGGTASSEER